MTLLREWNRACLPPWSEPELVHKVRSAANAQHGEARGYLLGDGGAGGSASTGRKGPRALVAPAPPKPAFCPMVLKRIAAKAAAVLDVVRFVQERSPVPVVGQDSASFLRWLYPRGSGESVLIFSRLQSQGQMLWKADQSDLIRNRHLPAGADGVWFLPQPVDGQFHANPRIGGKRSRRSEEAVTSWRYALLESDEADTDDWLPVPGPNAAADCVHLRVRRAVHPCAGAAGRSQQSGLGRASSGHQARPGYARRGPGRTFRRCG